MQKLIWTNGKGDSINLTSGDFGITHWEGFSDTSVNIQSQQIPMVDGSVFLDALLDNRELNVTLAINDNNNLEKRYRLKRELIASLNPKLGEGYLIYKNDFISKRIKCTPQIPLFSNKNSNDRGTQKGELSWMACEPYWEDLEENILFLKYGVQNQIVNNGDIPCDLKIDLFTTNVVNPQIKNMNNHKLIKLNGEFDSNIFIDTSVGNKKVTEETFINNLVNLASPLNSICYSEEKNLFVAVGNYGTILTSSDGIEWNLSERIDFNYLNSVCYSENLNLFIIVGDHGTILTSPDGINWTSRNSEISSELNSICYSEEKNLFVAIGYQGTIITSPDGINWTSRSSGFSNRLNSICYSKNEEVFVTVGYQGNILTSPDGINWTNTTPAWLSTTLNSICYSEDLNLFVAVGNNGIIVTCDDDGLNWRSRTSGTNFDLYSISYFENLKKFYCGSSTLILTSSDGIVWEDSQIPQYVYSIEYSSKLGILISVGNLGNISISLDGRNWESKYNNNYGLTSIFASCYSKKLKLFVSGDGNGRILTSPDGINWTILNNTFGSSLHSICYSEELNLFVAVGFSGRIITSSDGITWTSRNSGTTYTLRSICYSEELNLFIIVGDYGTILTSSDGITWTSRSSGTTNDLYSVCCSENLIIATENSRIYTSPDGINWTNGGIVTNINSICYSKNLNLFVTVGYNGNIRVSSNGVNWIEHEIVSNNLLYVTYSEELGLFIAVGASGNLFVSSNGVNWKKHPTNYYGQIHSACYSEDLNCLIISGENNFVMRVDFFNENNIISLLNEESDMTFNLELGENFLLLNKQSGNISGRVRYRQKYIGV